MMVLPILNGIFCYLLRAPTPEGRPVMDQIEGFRMYMETAESGRLNIDKSPEITAERFEALLPYAVALDVEQPWANAFASALARAHPGDTDPMSHYRSRWRRGGSWSSDNFGRSVSSAVASATSAATSSLPRSSSSSSGFSGGSGGGGGGDEAAEGGRAQTNSINCSPTSSASTTSAKRGSKTRQRAAFVTLPSLIQTTCDLNGRRARAAKSSSLLKITAPTATACAHISESGVPTNPMSKTCSAS